METLSKPAFTYVAKSYYLLTKPGIIMGNVITASGAFLLASRGTIDLRLFLAMFCGLSLIIASACVFNNFIDREIDAKMARTRNRALVQGLIPPKKAILFGIFLGLSGSLILGLLVNILSLGFALFGFFVYVILYSFSKTRTIHGTLVGSMAGAVPPVVGYCAVSNRFDLCALILFTMMTLWQMPHFFAIAIYRFKDYAAASIPVLPIKKGMYNTKVQMMLYILAFTGVTSMLSIFNYTGMEYLTVATILGSIWLGLCIKGFNCDSDTRWARKMFLFSIVIVMTLSLMIPLSVI